MCKASFAWEGTDQRGLRFVCEGVNAAQQRVLTEGLGNMSGGIHVALAKPQPLTS